MISSVDKYGVPLTLALHLLEFRLAQTRYIHFCNTNNL